MATTTTELLWLCELLKELGHPIIKTLQLFFDNIGATYVCVNPVFHTCMKHLAIDYHFACDLVAFEDVDSLSFHRKQPTVDHAHSS